MELELNIETVIIITAVALTIAMMMFFHENTGKFAKHVIETIKRRYRIIICEIFVASIITCLILAIDVHNNFKSPIGWPIPAGIGGVVVLLTAVIPED